MPIFKGLSSYGSSNDTFPVVLDIGEAYTKIGFAGESEPRAIIPSCIQRLGSETVYIFKRCETGQSSLDNKDTLQKNIQIFLEKVYFKILQVSPSKHCVIICENMLMNSKFRQAIADVLFNRLDARSILYAPHHLMACFTVACGTCLVLDCAYAESTVIPVVEWTPLLWAWQAAPLGSAAIHNSIMKQMKEKGSITSESTERQPVEELSENILEDIKIRTCFISEYERSRQIYENTLKKWRNEASSEEVDSQIQDIPEVIYPLDGKTHVIVPGSVREESCEVLFEKDNDEISVATLILDALLKSPLDSRKDLANNLIVIGGTCMLPGFRHRLLKELIKTVSDVNENHPYTKLKAMEFRLHNPPTHANLVSWLGASIRASLQDFNRKCITKEYYHQHKCRLPDWCVNDLPPPESVPERKSNYSRSTVSPRPDLRSRRSPHSSPTRVTLANLSQRKATKP